MTPNLDTLAYAQEDVTPGVPPKQEHIPFTHFIFRNKTNRTYLWIALIGTLVQFIIFKILYPFPDFFSDSYSYIYAAQANLDINIWPIGYSKFLRAFHFITHSDTALIAFQYFFFELTALYFFFSILYFYKPVRTNRIILFVFLFFNPLFLYVCNYVNSDPIFIALSIIWFTQLIWMIYSPMMYQVFTHAIILFLCFTVRNNAYYYPVITLIAILMSTHRRWIKTVGILLPALLIGTFIYQTREAAYKLTGTRMFSLFTGWQLANNALYMYEYADTVKSFNSAKLKELDNLSIRFYSMVSKDFHSEFLSKNPGNFFIQYSESPLKKYMNLNYNIKNEYDQLKAWGQASIVFDQYGSYLIKHNLTAYFHEFLVPNAKNYLFPYLEKLKIYNLGQEFVPAVVKNWFNYRNTQITSTSKTIQGYILYILPFLFAILNSYFVIMLFIFWSKEKRKLLMLKNNQALILISNFLLLNFVFCITVTIIVFRYEVFPLVICLTISLLLTEWLEQTNKREEQIIHDKHISSIESTSPYPDMLNY